MNIKPIFYAALCAPFFANAQFSYIDIVNAACMSAAQQSAASSLPLVAEKLKHPNDQFGLPPALQKIGPYAVTLTYAFFISAIAKADARQNASAISFSRYKKNIAQTVVGAGIGCIGTELIDRALNKLGYGQDSMYVRPAVLFAGSVGAQLVGQMIASKIMEKQAEQTELLEGLNLLSTQRAYLQQRLNNAFALNRAISALCSNPVRHPNFSRYNLRRNLW